MYLQFLRTVSLMFLHVIPVELSTTTRLPQHVPQLEVAICGDQYKHGVCVCVIVHDVCMFMCMCICVRV